MKCFYCEEAFHPGQYISIYKERLFCSNPCAIAQLIDDKEIKRVEYKGEEE